MDNQTLVQLGAGALTLVGSLFTGYMAYRTLKANQIHEEKKRYQRSRSILDLKDREAIFKLQEEIREQADKRIEELEDRIERLQDQLNKANEEKYNLMAKLIALQQAHDSNLHRIEKYEQVTQQLTNEVAILKLQIQEHHGV